MKTLLSLALAAATVASFAQPVRPSSVTVVSRPVVSEHWELPMEWNARNKAVRERVYKFAMDVSPALAFDLERYDRSARPSNADAIFAGLYNSLLSARDLRLSRAYTNMSPGLRGSMDTAPMMMNVNEGLFADVADRRTHSLSDYEAAKLLGDYQNDAGRTFIFNAFLQADAGAKSAIMKFLSAAAAEGNAPLYPVTLVQRTYTWAPIR